MTAVHMALENGLTSAGEATLFWVLAPITVLAALALLFSKRAIYAVISVVFVMINLAVFYVAQGAIFLGVAQVVVYTGAIMMLFVFVLMLVGVDKSENLTDTIKGNRAAAFTMGLGLVAILIGVITRTQYPVATGLAAANAESNPVGVAKIVFSEYVFALEILGILLIIAAVSAVVMTHRIRLTRHIGQPERQRARIKSGKNLAPLAPPGVYARGNAMDLPALDPYGKQILETVPRVLRVRGQVRDAGDVMLGSAKSSPVITKEKGQEG